MVGSMDPVTLVVAALVAGATKGVGDAAASAVKDAYGVLKSKLRAIFADDPIAEMVLTQHEGDPDTYGAPLRKKLEAAGVTSLGEEDELVVAAQQVLAVTDPAGARSGWYAVGSISADRGGVAAAHIEGDVTAGYKVPRTSAHRSVEN